LSVSLFDADVIAMSRSDKFGGVLFCKAPFTNSLLHFNRISYEQVTQLSVADKHAAQRHLCSFCNGQGLIDDIAANYAGFDQNFAKS
jgi:hypothetical protein